MYQVSGLSYFLTQIVDFTPLYEQFGMSSARLITLGYTG